MSDKTRREFLEESLFAAFAASVAATTFSVPQKVLAQNAVDANEQLGIAIIGAGGRGGDHVGFFSKDKRTKILYLCDPDVAQAEKKCDQIEKNAGYRPKAINDFRKILEEKSVDAVTCAATNHWHTLTAIWAMQAGKHCYIEKPLTYNIHEGKAIVAAAKKYGLVVQTGTQCRSAKNVIDAVKFIRDGGIGDVKFARGLCYKRRAAIGKLGEYKVPDGINYDLWSGPAQIKPVTRPKFHYDWHWQRYYGNGDLGNQGPHQTDISRWFLDVERFPQSVISYGGRLGYDVERGADYVDAGDVANTEVSIYDYGDKCLVFETRGLATPNMNIPVGENFGTQVGVIAYGTKGYVIQGSAKGQSYSVSYAYDLEGKQIKAFQGGDNHYSNFVEAVLKRDPAAVNADARCGALSAAVSHLGNTSYYLGEKNKISVDDLKEYLKSVKSLDDNEATLARTVQHLEKDGVDLKKTPLSLGALLKIDVEKEVFIDNAEANALATRDYRAPYVVPKPEDV
ncbi:MAG: Gfo/Idh/MocA family oxidoreductase [Planctomycetaceae bacterium]|jgi:predicted dehydrogenase|nr:Gfo/Idh/MocA family oxidoreductase [Planctomycetaceae bacterium]